MQNSSESEDENQNSENENDLDNESTDDWDIQDAQEKQFWDNHITNQYTYQYCPTCHIGKLTIKENNKNKFLNPYVYVAIIINGKNITLRKYSFFLLNPKNPLSVICSLYIIF